MTAETPEPDWLTRMLNNPPPWEAREEFLAPPDRTARLIGAS